MGTMSFLTRGVGPLGIAAGVTLVVGAVFLVALTTDSPLREKETWQKLTSPGDLSAAHSSLSNDCAACHKPVRGVEAVKCMVCHAGNRDLLQRQPTAFHATIGQCSPCHAEHLGRNVRPTQMDHSALSRIALQQQKETILPGGKSTTPSNAPNSTIRVGDATGRLDCNVCHSTKDRHRGLFGQNCASCHGTTTWSIPEYRHPSPKSRDCAQCHQPPPSHLMEHFHMVSMRVAREHGARVDQCFKCHETTNWNDIAGVGWYKHH